MAPTDVEVAEDVWFLNLKVNDFCFTRILLDLENLGKANSILSNNPPNHFLEREYLLNLLGELMKIYTNELREVQAEIGPENVYMITLHQGINANEEFLFSKYDVKKAHIETAIAATPFIPRTFALKSSDDAIRRAYKMLKSDKPKFGKHTTEAAFLYLFQGKPITSNYQPVIWEHSLRCLVFFFSKLFENGILHDDEWQSAISNHSLIYFKGKAIRKGTFIKDYEYTKSSSVGWLYLANIQIMLQRIHP